jgi:hypothetical protein
MIRVNRTAPSSGTAAVMLRCGDNLALGQVPTSRLSGVNAGTDLTADLEEETHASEHLSATDPVVAGSSTQVQFNDAGVLGGDAQLAYDKTTNTLTIGDGSTQGILDVKCPTPGSMDCESTYTEDTFGASPAAGFRKLQAQSAGFAEKDSAGNTGRLLSTRTGSATSAELAGTLTDETGSAGGIVRATSPAITTPTLVTYLDSAEAAAPGTPAAGVVRFYAKNSATAEFCSKDDAGTETCMSAGSGGSGITYADAIAANLAGF